MKEQFLKEIARTLSFSADLIDQEGKAHKVLVDEKILEKYYSILNLNRKVQFMDLIDAISKMTNSSQEVSIFGALFNDLDQENCIKINVSEESKKLNIHRTGITKILKKGIECNFLKKIGQKEYFINPLIIKGSKFRTNALFEQVQRKWMQLDFEELIANPESTNLITAAEELTVKYDLSDGVEWLICNDFFLSILQQKMNGYELSEKQEKALIKSFKR